MKITTNIELSTNLVSISNSYDYTSAENLSDYISDMLIENASNTNVNCKVVSRDFGELIFKIYIKKYCIDNDFTCTIYAESNIDIEESNNNLNTIWDKLQSDVRFCKELVEYIKTFVESLNNVTIYIPKKESFRFEDGRYFIEMDPMSPYLPEFTTFNIDTDINEDIISENIVVF